MVQKRVTKSTRSIRKNFEYYLAKFADLDTFLAQKSSTVDILFLSQNRYLKKTEFINYVKSELQFYINYFNPDLEEEEFDSMYDRVEEIEKRYKWLLAN